MSFLSINQNDYKNNADRVANPSYHILDLPTDLNELFMGYLDVKDLGRMAQVSKTYNVFANLKTVWQNLCHANSDIDTKELVNCGGDYKLLYKNESLLRVIQKGSEFNFKTSNKTYKINLECNDSRFNGEHLYKIVKKNIKKDPELAESNLDNFKIIDCGREVGKSDRVSELGWAESESLFIKF